MSTVLQATLLLLTMANARAEEPATPLTTGSAPEAPAAEEPPPDERVDGSDTIDVVEGSPEVLRKRAEVYQSLRERGYRKGKRKGEFLVFNSYTPWEPRVFVHDDGWIMVKRAPPRIHAPGRSFANEGKKREYLWCLIVPTACVSVGGWVVSDAKLAPRVAEVYDQTAPEVRALNDAVAKRALSERLATQIPTDLEAIWGKGDLTAEARRELLYTYWDSRTDTPEGRAAQDAVRAFLEGVVQTSSTPFSADELTRLNAQRSSPRALRLSGAGAEDTPGP